MVASTTRRRSDLAVLRCLGFERRELSMTVRAQAATVIAVGLAVRMPIGAAVGRWSWRLVSAGIGVGTDPASVSRDLLVIILGALLVTAPSARSAARTRPALVLRAE